MNKFRISNFEFRNFVFALAAFVLSACAVAPPPTNGWAIAAADPTTGDVGVAGASCSQFPLDARAALVPKKGAGVQLGVLSTLQRDRFSAWLEATRDAPTVVHDISALTNDPDAAQRQYAIVTIYQGNVHAAVFSGADSTPYANALQDERNVVAVAGSGLANENVLHVTLDAFRAPENSTLALSDKLMRALEAGSAAGGISLCNTSDGQQTASTTFITMARGDDPHFLVKTLGGTAAQESDAPFLALSATTPFGGPNAIHVLREMYNAWRPQHLPACADCLQTHANVPSGGTRTAPADARIAKYALLLVTMFVVFVIGATIGYVILHARRNRHTHFSARSESSG